MQTTNAIISSDEIQKTHNGVKQGDTDNKTFGGRIKLPEANTILLAASGKREQVRQADITVDYNKELGAFSPYLFGTVAPPYFNQSGFIKAKEAGFKMISPAPK